MADWLSRIVEEVDKQYEELPSWNKREDESGFSCHLDQGRSSSVIKEPRND